MQSLALVADHCREFKWDMSNATNRFLQHQCHVDVRGFAMFDSDHFRALSKEQACAVVRELLMHIGARAMPPPTKSMLRLVDDLQVKYMEYTPRTVGGCVVLRKYTDRWNVVITRETPSTMKNTREPLHWDSPLYWDNRFLVSASLATRSPPPSGGRSGRGTRGRHVAPASPPQRLFIGPLSDPIYAKVVCVVNVLCFLCCMNLCCMNLCCDVVGRCCGWVAVVVVVL
jgi:hypothetical protein